MVYEKINDTVNSDWLAKFKFTEAKLLYPGIERWYNYMQAHIQSNDEALLNIFDI